MHVETRKIIFKDLQENVARRAMVQVPIDVSKIVEIALLDLKPPKLICIRNIKGFLQSDSGQIIYLMDGNGRRYMLRSVK